jgi:hypothetical protein
MADRNMEMITASQLSSLLPDTLPALCFFQRPSTSPIGNLFVVGDIGLSGQVATAATSRGFSTLFQEIAPLLQSGQIVFGNLEFPFVESPSKRLFAAQASGALSLKESGFTLLHLANNHIYDHGPEEMRFTLEKISAVGLMPLGAGNNVESASQLVRTDIGNLRVGWLGCGRTLQPQDRNGPNYWEFAEDALTIAIQQAKPLVDILIVSIHIGHMYLDYPRPEYKRIAEKLMETGANLVLMHHAHVLQGVQVTSQNKICCYNLGNFLLDWREGNVTVPIAIQEQNEGAVFAFELDSLGIASATAIPTFIAENCQVQWAVGQRGQQILDRLARISLNLDGDFNNLYEQQRAERNIPGILQVLKFHALKGNWKLVADALKNFRIEHARMLLRWVLSRLSGKQS